MELEFVSFFGPIALTHNNKLGRHYTATRTIQPGEVILVVRSIVSYPWLTYDGGNVICCGCYQNLDNNSWTKCQECKWPVCDSICEKVKYAYMQFFS